MSTAQSISFDLHKLGWKAFEDLVACVFRDVLGYTFQIFAEGTDGGRDGAFYGKWSLNDQEVLTGSFTIQCKHTSSVSKLLPKSIIQDELPNVKNLAKQGLSDHYIFVTNYKVTANRAQKAEAAFVDAGAKSAKIYGPDWINAIIIERPTLRRLVPRLYGLGDLTQAVTHQAYRQAREVLSSIAPDLNCFVPTDAYRKSAHALKEHGFVLLIGEPASGKTMIANLLAISAADEWNLQTLMLSGPEEFSNFWNPDDPGQFLWVDDAFGANQYDSNRVREWNHRLPKLKTAIKQKARVVFTSRDYIFNSAKKDLKISSFELFDDSRVLIEVEKLSIPEREMILYNHLKCGSQPVDFKKEVKPYLVDAAKTPKFLPEIARRFGSPKFTKNLPKNQKSVLNFFDKPMKWLGEVLVNLTVADRAAIALVFIAGGRLPTPVPDEALFGRTLKELGSNIGEVKAALPTLNESLLRLDKENGARFWCFRHPTMRDAFASLIGVDTELVDIYLAGVTTEQLMEEVTCGNLNLEGVEIIIPQNRYESVLEKLRDVKPTQKWSFLDFDQVVSFLARRCTSGFLQKYFTEVEDMSKLPKTIRSVENYDNSLLILKRLNEDGLLPEHIRQDTVKRIYEISTNEYSSNFLDQNKLGGLLTSAEIDTHWKILKDQVLSNSDKIIDEIRCNWDKEYDPDTEFYDLEQTVEHIAGRGSEEEQEQASTILRAIEETVSAMQDELPDQAEYDSLEAEETSVETESVVRSIFDDVDE